MPSSSSAGGTALASTGLDGTLRLVGRRQGRADPNTRGWRKHHGRSGRPGPDGRRRPPGRNGGHLGPRSRPEATYVQAQRRVDLVRRLCWRTPARLERGPRLGRGLVGPAARGRSVASVRSPRQRRAGRRLRAAPSPNGGANSAGADRHGQRRQDRETLGSERFRADPHVSRTPRFRRRPGLLSRWGDSWPRPASTRPSRSGRQPKVATAGLCAATKAG